LSLDQGRISQHISSENKSSIKFTPRLTWPSWKRPW